MDYRCSVEAFKRSAWGGGVDTVEAQVLREVGTGGLSRVGHSCNIPTASARKTHLFTTPQRPRPFKTLGKKKGPQGCTFSGIPASLN